MTTVELENARITRPVADHRFCVAPMMDCTDRHLRFLLRLISRRALLYTEMVTTGAVIHGDRRRFLSFHPDEHPLALQLGGSDPQDMARCAALAAEAGFDEVNVNVGCPSDRVQSGRFGACLMAEPARVAECVSAMRAAAGLPVTVKTRIGIDHRDSFEALLEFVDTVNAAGCETFIVHARKAWLEGLSPRENRSVPPLRYDVVMRLKQQRPRLEIVLNGGIASLDEAEGHLDVVDGVMLGRAAYHNPYLLAGVDARFFGEHGAPRERTEVLRAYIDYVEARLGEGVPLPRMSRHLVGLFLGQPGARAWRRALSEQAHRAGAGTEVIEAALAHIRQGDVSTAPAPPAQGVRGDDPRARATPAA
jgi:tRNA-dihydrouridine synthase A